MDVRLPGMSGLEAFRTIHEIEPKLPVIIMTAYGTTETAIEATKLGAFEYLLKPLENFQDILTMIGQALEAGRCMRSRVELDVAPAAAGADAIIGQSNAMQEVYKAIGRVAPTDATVLIRGESGTGKELVARAIYQHSLRAAKPFLVINCVAIPETLLESELFGYEKGAFTGAINRRVGKFEQAHGGTVFLDEIGDMPFSIQAKILRLLQERSIERLGGREPIPVDVRIIAATNRDLEAALASRQIPGGPLLPPQGGDRVAAALKGADRGPDPAGGIFPGPLRQGDGAGQSGHDRGGQGVAQIPTSGPAMSGNWPTPCRKP